MSCGWKCSASRRADNDSLAVPRPSTSTRAQTIDSSGADSGTEANARAPKRKPEESILVKKEKIRKASSSDKKVIDLDDSEEEVRLALPRQV